MDFQSTILITAHGPLHVVGPDKGTWSSMGEIPGHVQRPCTVDKGHLPKCILSNSKATEVSLSVKLLSSSGALEASQVGLQHDGTRNKWDRPLRCRNGPHSCATFVERHCAEWWRCPSGTSWAMPGRGVHASAPLLLGDPLMALPPPPSPSGSLPHWLLAFYSRRHLSVARPRECKYPLLIIKNIREGGGFWPR